MNGRAKGGPSQSYGKKAISKKNTKKELDKAKQHAMSAQAPGKGKAMGWPRVVNENEETRRFFVLWDSFFFYLNNFITELYILSIIFTL